MNEEGAGAVVADECDPDTLTRAHHNSTKESPRLAGDILHGADAIAEFLYGDRKSRRKVYHLVESGHIPFFRLGSNVCARRGVLLSWIEAQEKRQAASGSLLRE